MKILYLATDFNLVGGKEQYDRNVLHALYELDHPARAIKLLGTSLLQKLSFAVRSCIYAVAIRPDIIFLAHLPFLPMGKFIQEFLNIPYVVSVHGIEAWHIKKDSHKKALLKARAVLAVSRYTAEKLWNQIPNLKKKIFFLKNMVDGKEFSIQEKPQYILERHNLKDAKVILTVSRLYPSDEKKGHLNVINALPIVQKVFPNVRYVIVGSGLKGFGDNRQRISQYAREQGVGGLVILTGRVSSKELGDYYNACDVFVMPSTQEGFGVVFLEALASGKPVIAGNRDGSREAVLEGELGILVNPESKEEIARAIIKVFRGEAEGRFYNREYLRKRVLEVYGHEKFKENLTKFLAVLKK